MLVQRNACQFAVVFCEVHNRHHDVVFRRPFGRQAGRQVIDAAKDAFNLRRPNAGADPNSLLEIFTCDQIGSSSDSNYCNEEYDALFEQQNAATSESERKALIDQMQEIFYRDAPYHILFYDAQLDAYRTDRFGGWQNQPTSNGVPLFGYGSLGYTLLTPAAAASPSPSDGPAPSASAGESGAPATPAPSGDGGTGGA